MRKHACPADPTSPRHRGLKPWLHAVPRRAVALSALDKCRDASPKMPVSRFIKLWPAWSEKHSHGGVLLTKCKAAATKTCRNVAVEHRNKATRTLQAVPTSTAHKGRTRQATSRHDECRAAMGMTSSTEPVDTRIPEASFVNVLCCDSRTCRVDNLFLPISIRGQAAWMDTKSAPGCRAAVAGEAGSKAANDGGEPASSGKWRLLDVAHAGQKNRTQHLTIITECQALPRRRRQHGWGSSSNL